MKIIRRLAWALPLAAATCGALAQDAGPKQPEFRSKSGTGRVVVVISGQSGMTPYAGVAQKFADAGFNVTLVDGNDFWLTDTRRAWALVRQVITRAQAGPNALPVRRRRWCCANTMASATASTCRTRRSRTSAAGQDALARTVAHLKQALP